MNLLVFKPCQFSRDQKRIEIYGRQHQHLCETLKAKVGTQIRVGLLNGDTGNGTVESIDTNRAVLSVALNRPPLPHIPLTLILALPRPQMIKRILQTIACMGVSHLHLIQTSKVEKNYWQSPTVADANIEEHLILGLEQGGSTRLPTVVKHQNMKAFFEQTIHSIADGCDHSLVAHLGEPHHCPSFFKSPNTKVALAIGPEGGFTDEEVLTFEQASFQPVQLGARILRVETAVTALITKLYL